MLKNKAWIVALLAALTMVFFGCIDPTTFVDDGSGPKPPAEDLEILGKDLTYTAIGNNSSAVTIDGNEVTIGGTTSAGFFIDFPKESEGYNEFVVYFKILEITAGRPGLLMKKNTKMEPLPTQGDDTQEYQLKDEDFNFTVGMEFNTSSRISGEVAGKTPITNPAFGKYLKKDMCEGGIAFQHQAWNPSGNEGANYAVEVIKMVFIGDSTPVIVVPPPSFGGGADKVVYTKTAGVETIVDSDPLIVGSDGLAVSTEGYFKIVKGGNISYGFPSSAKDFTGDPKIGDDWDFVDVEYLARVVTKGKDAAGAEESDADLMKVVYSQFGDTSKAYAAMSTGVGSQYDQLADDGTATTPSAQAFQTWGVGGSGGLTIRMNDWDLPTGGGKGKCAEEFEVKIVKVTFTKGTRYKVSFYADPNASAVTYPVLDGNTIAQSNIPDSVTKPKKAGWTFVGWETFGVVSPAVPVEVALSDEIDSALVTDLAGRLWLLAKFDVGELPDAELEAPANGTLFAPAGNFADNSYAGVTYNGKKYWTVSDARVFKNEDGDVDKAAFLADAVAPFDAGAGVTQADTIWTAHNLPANADGFGYTRLGLDLSSISSSWQAYDKIIIYYEAVDVSGDGANNIRGTLIKNGSPVSGAADAPPSVGNIYPNWEPGEDKKMEYNVAGFTNGVFGIVKNNPGMFLLRVTKVVLTSN